MSDITIYSARTILTMDPSRPRGTHVAVREGRVLGVGTLDELAGWGDHTLDERFSSKVLMPGFVEGHAHAMAGAMWRHTYVDHMQRVDPDGRAWSGITSVDGLVERLKAQKSNQPALLAWGYDPLFVSGERLSRRQLDEVSTDMPVVVMHSNGHLMTCNSAALALAGYDRNTQVEGVCKDAAGEPDGELREMAAMGPVHARLGIMGAMSSEDTYRAYARLCRLAGVTTAADLGTAITRDSVPALESIIDAPDFPVRVALVLMGHNRPPAEVASEAVALAKLGTSKVRLGGVKIVLDGSIQGYTAKLRWPGYYKGKGQGIWNIVPEAFFDLVEKLNDAGVQTHVHTNGDEATALAIEAFDRALAKTPRFDHRHTLQHCQMADEAQFRRMKQLGLGVNLFANHLYYFGDKHYELTLGPDRAERMDACGTALRLGVPLAIHSDEPVTPMAPLVTAWCAVNRLTENGRVLGENQRITVAQALHAITIGGAWSLGLDHEVGSIEVGKWADFALLDEDPLAIDPLKLRDVPVAGTVLAGVPTDGMG